MEHISFPTEKLYLRFQKNLVTEYKLTSIELLKNNLNLRPIHDFIGSTPTIQLQNLWNWVVKHWNRIHDTLSHTQKFRKSPYYKYKYNYLHREIDHLQLDELFQIFIDKDKMKALFVIQCLLKYVFPT
uniref:Uncharacterized protein n=1 Tax=viral metagenome TaxID=1070528 RepID=A0A6C0F581_9ZZZZ